MDWPVMMPNQISIWLSQEDPTGGEWKWTCGFFSSHAWTSGAAWVERLSRTTWICLPAWGVTAFLAFLRKARKSAPSRVGLHSPKTSPVPTFSAANHQPGAHVGVAHVPVRQQHLGHGAGALRVAEVGAPPHPERLVRGCEHPRFAGLGQRRGTGERAGLAHQHLQVVVQREYRIALGGAALGPGHQ